MNLLNTDFVKCDKTENKSLVVTLEPHWSPAVSQEAYDVKLPAHYPNLNEIIFSKEGTDDPPIDFRFFYRKNCFIKTLYLDLETLFTADNIAFDLPFNEDIIMHYQTDVILVSPIEHKEFRLTYTAWIITKFFQSFITIIWHLYHNNYPALNSIIINYHNPLSQEVEDIVKLQAEILSNFSEEEIKAMDMETSPLYYPIAEEFVRNNFKAFIQLINTTNNKETLNRLLTDEICARELSGEAKAIIIKRMAELDDERSFEL